MAIETLPPVNTGFPLNRKPVVWLYSICYNEEAIVAAFLRHYWWCQRVIVFDNESTDLSVPTLLRDPRVEVRTYRSDNTIQNRIFSEIKNSCWKEAREQGVDYVVVVDMDEFAFCENIVERLHALKCEGVTLIRGRGYDMVSPTFPVDGDLSTITLGAREECYDKTCIFDPRAIEEINYGPGAHSCNPIGKVSVYCGDDIQLRHFRFLGFRYFWERTYRSMERLSPEDRSRGWGSHYLQGGREQWSLFQARLSEALPLNGGTNGSDRGKTGIWSFSEATSHHRHSPGLASFFAKQLEPGRPVLDVGCGVGFYMSVLASHGFSCAGIEGTRGIEALALHPSIVEADLTRGFKEGAKPGHVLCLEVGAHIPAEHEQRLLDELADVCTGTLALSWPIPGQPGLRHVNARENEYFIHEMERRGLRFDKQNTEHARAYVTPCMWLQNSLMIFQRERSDAAAKEVPPERRQLASEHLEFVIARCNEDIQWTASLPGKVTVYDKGKRASHDSTLLPNYGRESATYLTHIVRNYDTLAEFTCFLQGKVGDHSADILRKLAAPMTEFCFLSDQVLTCEWDGAPHHRGLPLREVFEELFQNEIAPERLGFGRGALFSVSRKAIHARPLAFYENALLMHERMELAPWVFERLWGHIFTPNCEANVGVDGLHQRADHSK